MRRNWRIVIIPALLLLGSSPVLAESVARATAQSPADDPIGMGIGWALMVGMLIALAYAVWRLAAYWPDISDILAGEVAPTRILGHWIVPVLGVVGIAVAVYLTYIESTGAAAVCGPVGHCNVVQASPYARIFGIPVGLLGVMNYIAVIVFWLGARAKAGQIAVWSAVLMLALTLFGVLFSIYLTYVELRLIFAVCIYCMTSALITTILMLIALTATTALPLDEAN